MNDDRRVIVIGSGPAGAMAALTLVERGIPVTMLESGTQPPRGWLVRVAGRNVVRKRPQVEDPKCHVATDDPRAQWFHALAPGGMSSHWAGAVPRFAPEDFHEGDRLGEAYRWPLDYEDLTPYYERVERLMAVAASRRNVACQPAPDVAYDRELPKDWDRIAEKVAASGQGLAPLPVAAGPQWAIRRTGVGFNSYTHIVQPLERSPLFHLVLGAHALRLEWRGDLGRVNSVTYVDRASGEERSIDGAAVVVAAGPLASAQLLLASTSTDFPSGLGETEGILGRYLHDHPHDIGAVTFERPLSGLGQAAVLTRAPYWQSEPLLAASCVIGSNSAWDKARTVTPLGSKTFGVWIFGTMVPSVRNYVKLDRTATDEFGLPVLDVHIRYDDDVIRNTARARERLVQVMTEAGHPCSYQSSLPTLVPGQSVHYGGTVRMHHSKHYGMLNGWNRLHEVDNVVVADASCFTTGPEKNPTLTVMAIAARASDRLASDLKRASLKIADRRELVGV